MNHRIEKEHVVNRYFIKSQLSVKQEITLLKFLNTYMKYFYKYKERFNKKIIEDKLIEYEIYHIPYDERDLKTITPEDMFKFWSKFFIFPKFIRESLSNVVFISECAQYIEFFYKNVELLDFNEFDKQCLKFKKDMASNEQIEVIDQYHQLHGLEKVDSLFLTKREADKYLKKIKVNME